MEVPYQVSIPDLIKISKKLISSFFPGTDMYSLLLLALVTVSSYSRKKHHLNNQTCIDLTIEFIPDLLNYLLSEDIIDKNTEAQLKKALNSRKNEIPIILTSYIYAAGGLHIKMEIKADESKKICIVA